MKRVRGYFDQLDTGSAFALGIRVCLLIEEKQPTILRRGNSRNWTEAV